MDLWCRWFRPSIVPSLWSRLDEIIKSGQLIASEEVFHDLEKKEDGLHDWVKERKEMLVGISDEIQDNVTKIMKEFPKFVDERTGKSFADPFVIATAMETETIVVTGESGGTASRPKIPYVCDHLGVPWIPTIELIEHHNWQF